MICYTLLNKSNIWLGTLANKVKEQHNFTLLRQHTFWARNRNWAPQEPSLPAELELLMTKTCHVIIPSLFIKISFIIVTAPPALCNLHDLDKCSCILCGLLILVHCAIIKMGSNAVDTESDIKSFHTYMIDFVFNIQIWMFIRLWCFFF